MKHIALLAALIVATLTPGLVNESPAAADVSHWCGDVPAPCIQSATRNGSTITKTDPTYYLYLADFQPTTEDPSHFFVWDVQDTSNADQFDLGSGANADTWTITFDAGDLLPRVTWTQGGNVTVTRNDDGDGTYHVTVTTNPTLVLGNCDQSAWPWTCDNPATVQRTSLQGEVTDYNAWTDTTQRNAMYGMDYFTNVSATSLPPEITSTSTGTAALLIRLANPHFEMDGSTVFHGFTHVNIPDAFLRNVYGIDDPSTLAGTGVATDVSGSTVGSGTVSVTHDDAANQLVVDIQGMTFSARKVTIKAAHVTPTAPTNLHAKRIAPTKGRLTFHKATARGSKIRLYRAFCGNRATDTAGYGHATSSPIVVTHLTPGVAYTCRVWAVSRAGDGAKSKAATLPR